MLYKQTIISLEPGLIHGQGSIKSVIYDAVENCFDPFYDAIRHEVALGNLPSFGQRLEAVASNRRENPNLCFDKEKRAKS